LPEVTARDADDPSRRQDLEALCCPDGYLRDAAVVLRPWEWDPVDVVCPVLVVHGALDEQASVRNAHWLAAQVPGAGLRLLPDAAHLEALHRSWEELFVHLTGAGQL
jgi:pimeloyl-ACP methyl ester carboxylesterase